MSITSFGLKLGSGNSFIFKPNEGIVLTEPTIIAISTNLKNREIKAVGHEAKKMIGRLPENVSVFSPVSGGAVQYEEMTALLIREFMKKVYPERKFNQKFKAILLVPECLSQNELKQFENCCYKAGISEVSLLPEIFSFDLGNTQFGALSGAKIYVNIGFDQTCVAVLSDNQIVGAYSISVGSSIISIAIKKFIEDNLNLKIGTEQTDYIKNEICSLFDNYSASVTINGINFRSQEKEQFTVKSNDLYPIVSYYYGKIAETVKSIITSLDSIIVSDIAKTGINFIGGGSQIAGLEQFMQSKTGFNINLPDFDEMQERGLTELFTHPELLKKFTYNC